MPRRIRVLQVSKSTGGVGRYLRSLVHGLDRERYEVVAVCLSDGSAEMARDLSQLEGVRALTLEMDRYRINPLTDLQVWWKLARLVRQERYDVIHAHASKPGFLARVAALGTGIPVLYCPAGFSFHDGVESWKARLYATVERLIARLYTKKIVTVCNEERELARRYNVGSDAQFVNVYNGVAPEDFNLKIDRGKLRSSLNIPEDAFLIGTVARLSPQKAPRDLVEAARLVHGIYPQAHFIWVGDGELEQEIRTLIHSYALEGVFHLVGARRDVPELLQAMDCFVLSSHWEGFSISVLEAMASALPIVITQVSGAAEAVVNGETGYVVPIGDVKALAEAVGQLVAHPTKAKRFGEAGRTRLEQNFTLKQMVKGVEKIYDEVVLGTNS